MVRRIARDFSCCNRTSHRATLRRVPKTPTRPTPRERHASVPTDGWVPCPANALGAHPQGFIACQVMRGPKVFWTECPSCKSRWIIAPKFLKPGTSARPGKSLQQITSEGLTAL